MDDDIVVSDEGEVLVRRAGSGRFDIPALYEYFYEERNMELFEDFSFEEFVLYLKNHT
jgi:hypothetical protein